MARTGSHLRALALLAVSNVLGGVGVASGVAVGGLLAEQVGSTEVAGLAQAASVLGAAVAAIPLASLATRWGRRWSLTIGYLIALLGAFLILAAAVADSLLMLLLGLGTFGVAQAANLQSRYAAADGATLGNRATSMSVVIWATTIGSVAGPNLSAAGADLGPSFNVPALAGPYLFSVLAFAAAATVIGVLFRPVARPAEPRVAAAEPNVPDPAGSGPAEAGTSEAGSVGPEHVEVGGPTDPAVSPRAVGALAALRWAARHPVARFAVVLIAVAHATMVMVMVMTPLHMQHHGMGLELVGIVISLHVLGMYALSPVFGWLADKFGGVRVAISGIGILALAIVLGIVAASTGGGPRITAVALVVLGLGWSASLISASTLLAGVGSDRVRIPLQGATDAGMNYAGAAVAALAGPILAAGGFRAVNGVAALLLVPAVLLAMSALRANAHGERTDQVRSAVDD